MAGTVRAPLSAWLAVVLICVGFSVCTIGFIARLLPVFIVGCVLGVAGIVLGKAKRLMENNVH